MPLLHPGDTFPELVLKAPGGNIVKMPEAFAGEFGVLLFYPGSWCSCCNAQLLALQRAAVVLRAAALSVDDEAAVASVIAKHGLTFPIGFGADAHAVADLTGAFVNPDPVYLQSTWFVLDPHGRVAACLYSSGDARSARTRKRGLAGPPHPRARPGVRLKHWAMRWARSSQQHPSGIVH
jgi:peroxiredoxin